MKYCLQGDFFFNYIIIFKVKCPGNIVPPSHPLCLHPAWSVPALGLACLQAELDQPSCDSQACAGCRGRPWEMCVKHDTVPRTNHLLQPWLVFTIQPGVPWPTALFLPSDNVLWHCIMRMMLLLVIIAFCNGQSELHC